MTPSLREPTIEPNIVQFLIADTFTDSLARLTGDEQKAAKTTAFDLQMNPASPGLSFHKLDKARDKSFWSVRVSRDVRIIVHRTGESLLLCYVDHHDKAYDWAERRKIETHPTTGAAQIVEIRETVKEIVVPKYTHEIAPPKAAPLVFATIADADLLGYGVPAEWLADVKQATEETLLSLADHLPAEAAEALLEIATGGKPRAADAVRAEASPFEHPDALRRFRVMANVEELERALEFPWEKWTVFLHPDQRQVVTRDFAGSARVSGSAGTGKTIVALHRAAHLARTNPDARVLLTTYSDTLASALHTRLKRLLGSEPRLGERIDVHSLPAIGLRLCRAHVGPVNLASREIARDLVREEARAVAGHKFSTAFLIAEWEHVVDAWQLRTWEAYRDVARLGRRTRVPEAQRAVLWSIFERVRAALRERDLMTEAAVFDAVAAAIQKSGKILFDYAVVDEAQDLGVPQVKFFAAPGRGAPQLAFFHGRPRPAHLPATLLVEIARRRCPRTLAHAARELPHFASDSNAGGSLDGARGDGRGRKRGAPRRHDFSLQRTASGCDRREVRERGARCRRELAQRKGCRRRRGARDSRVRPVRAGD